MNFFFLFISILIQIYNALNFDIQPRFVNLDVNFQFFNPGIICTIKYICSFSKKRFKSNFTKINMRVNKNDTFLVAFNW